MKFKILFASVLVFLLSASSYLPAEGIGAGFSAGFRFGKLRSASFNQFREGYNEYYKNQLDKGLDGFRLGRGYSINGDMTFNGIVLGIRYSNFSTRDEAHFNHGGKRYFQLKQSLIATAVGAGVQTKKAYGQFTMALLIGNDKLNSGYEYPDGTVSYGSDAALNGFYRAIRMGWSARLEGGAGPLYVAAEYVYGKISGIGLPLHGSISEPGIPTDYDRWVSMPSFDYGLEDYVMPDFNGIRIEIGLRWNIAD